MSPLARREAVGGGDGGVATTHTRSQPDTEWMRLPEKVTPSWLERCNIWNACFYAGNSVEQICTKSKNSDRLSAEKSGFRFFSRLRKTCA